MFFCYVFNQYKIKVNIKDCAHVCVVNQPSKQAFFDRIVVFKALSCVKCYVVSLHCCRRLLLHLITRDQ